MQETLVIVCNLGKNKNKKDALGEKKEEEEKEKKKIITPNPQNSTSVARGEKKSKSSFQHSDLQGKAQQLT